MPTCESVTQIWTSTAERLDMALSRTLLMMAEELAIEVLFKIFGKNT